jgi:hypothetical protein
MIRSLKIIFREFWIMSVTLCRCKNIFSNRTLIHIINMNISKYQLIGLWNIQNLGADNVNISKFLSRWKLTSSIKLLIGKLVILHLIWQPPSPPMQQTFRSHIVKNRPAELCVSQMYSDHIFESYFLEININFTSHTFLSLPCRQV